jgi:RNA polymerase sigma-70 factor (ECF subfamily)
VERRAVLVLHDIDGQPAPEVGRALDIPVNTVYSRLRLARQEFKAEVERVEPPNSQEGTA